MVSGNRWLVSDYLQTWLNGTVVITFTTDIPVHVFMNYTESPIRMHLREKTVRGVGFMWEPYFCFVAYQTIEQDEPGDTLTHTITWPGWYHCLTLHFYFWAEKGGVETPTQWGIFEKHYIAPKVLILTLAGKGDENTIQYAIGAPNHWMASRFEDTTYVPPNGGGFFGRFDGAYVYTRQYNGWVWGRDLYQVGNLPPFVTDILSVAIWNLVGKIYVYGRTTTSLKTHGAVYDGPIISISGPGLVWNSEDYLVNPFTGLKWTVQEVADIQAGVQLAHQGTFGMAVCDRVHVGVTYRPTD